MRKTSIFTPNIWTLAIALFAAIGLATPQSSLAMTIPLNNLNGSLEATATGGLGFSGTSHTGSVRLSFDFTVPDISSSGFNSIVQSTGPINMTGELNLKEQGGLFGSTARVTLNNVFSGPLSFAQFLPETPNQAGEWTAIDEASLYWDTLQYTLSNIWLQLDEVTYGNSPGAGPGQITGGTVLLVADGFNGGDINADMLGDGSLTVTTAVPEPGTLALFGLGFVLLLVTERKLSRQR